MIKKGTKAYRITNDTKETQDRRYVTVDQNDRNFYKGMWPRTMKGKAGSSGKDQTIYESTYRLKEDLISPSAAKRQKWAAELTNKPEVQREIARTMMKSDMIQANQANASTVESWMKNWEKSKDKDYLDALERTTKQVASELKQRSEIDKAKLFLGTMGNSDRIKTIYGEKIIKENYNMVIDDHGADFAGNKQRVNSPIIILKANSSLEKIKDKPLSDFSSMKAMRKYQRDIKTISGSMSEKNFVPNVIKEGYGTNNYYRNPTFNYIYDKNNNMY